MDDKWLVYKHISPSNKVYIGITSVLPCERWARGRGYKECPMFYKAIQKYGWDNIEHKILIDHLTFEEAIEVERQLIAYYKSICKSYNVTDGGEGLYGYHHTDEYKEHIRQLQLGKPKSKESILKRLQTIKQCPYHLTEETKRKIGEAMKLVSHIKAAKAAGIANSKPVCVMRNNTEVMSFNSKTELANFFHISMWKVSTYTDTGKILNEVNGTIVTKRNQKKTNHI